MARSSMEETKSGNRGMEIIKVQRNAIRSIHGEGATDASSKFPTLESDDSN